MDLGANGIWNSLRDSMPVLGNGLVNKSCAPEIHS